ncbi:MAG: beta-ketoacyl-ACP synthase II [Phycisphaerales bacterium]|nr:beta-ketoacyl-ACP synthase II [bacterium]
MNTPAHTRERVVVTGIGAVTNLAHNARDTWAAMREGTSGISPITGSYFDEWSDDQWDVKIAGEVRDWDPGLHMDKREARRIDRFCQFAIVAANEAVAQAGIDFASHPDLTRCGIIIGSGIGGIQTIEDAVKVLWDKGPGRISPFTVPRLMANAASGDISIRFGLKGPSDSHTTACASSGHSIGDAFKLMQRGEADVMLAGGSEAAISPLCVGAFANMKALSTRNDEPTKASRPFDKDRDGFVLSEGAAVLVLETLSHAKARGAEILCEILGYGASSDAGHITAPDPNGGGAQRAMELAIGSAGLNPGDIDYLNAHGTSTPLGDAAEVKAATTLFGDHARKSKGGKLLMSSTKSMIGHCLGASGGVESIAVIGALREGVVTPTINCENPDEEFDMDFVADESREVDVRYALNNTFGFGGHNVSLLFGRFEG